MAHRPQEKKRQPDPETVLPSASNAAGSCEGCDKVWTSEFQDHDTGLGQGQAGVPRVLLQPRAAHQSAEVGCGPCC